MLLDKLYPYQLTNAETLASLGFGADLSHTGVGKTLTAFGVIHKLEAQIVLVVVPNTLNVNQWKKKFTRFMPEMIVFVPVKSDRGSRAKAYNDFDSCSVTPKVLVLTYDQVRIDVSQISHHLWDVIYTDETHKIGNPLTKIYKAMSKLNSRAKYAATATPLRSSPLQAYGIFNWINPGCLGKNYWHFKARYEVSDNRGWRLGFKNLDELAERIRPFCVKTTYEEAGIYMPSLVEEDLAFELGAKTKKLYQDVRKEMLLEIDTLLINKIENPTNLYLSVVKLGKLSEIADHLELVGDGDESEKLNTLKEHLADVVLSGNKVIIFTRFQRMADIIHRELEEHNPAIITGKVKDKQTEINKFNNDPTCRVLVGTIAISEGLDLQVANILYFYDVPMGSYGSMVQIIGRIRRIGQDKPMMVYYLLGEIDGKQTIDGKLKNLLLKKQEMSEKIFGSLAEVKEMLI